MRHILYNHLISEDALPNELSQVSVYRHIPERFGPVFIASLCIVSYTPSEISRENRFTFQMFFSFPTVPSLPLYRATFLNADRWQTS